MSEVPRHMRSHCELIREIKEQEKEIAELKDDKNLLSHELAQAVDIFNDHKKEIAELKKINKSDCCLKCYYTENKLAEARELISHASNIIGFVNSGDDIQQWKSAAIEFVGKYPKNYLV